MNIKNNIKQSILLTVLVVALCSVPVLILAANPSRVTTYGVRNIGMTSANLRGLITDDGGCADMDIWFEYGATRDYGQETIPKDHNGEGYFNQDVYDLAPCTTYYFRALSKNNTNVVTHGSDKIFKTQCASFDVTTSVKSLTRGDEVWYDILNVNPGDELLYRIKISSTGDVLIQNLMLASDLSGNISYEGDLKIDNKASLYNPSAGSINLGNLFPLQTKVLTFKAMVANESQLNFGKNELIHTVTAYSNDYSDVDTNKVYVNRSSVAGVSIVVPPPTLVSTGIGNDIFKSVFFPFVVALILVWIFKSKLIGFEKWARNKREKTIRYRTKRKLARKIDKLNG